MTNQGQPPERQPAERDLVALIAALRWQAQENGCYCETDISPDEAGIPIGERCPYCLMGKACQALAVALASRAAAPPTMADAAEMLWVVLANVSGGDWTKQTPEWQEAAARWRDNYFAAASPPERPTPGQKAENYCAACDREGATAGGDTTPLEFHACQARRAHQSQEIPNE